MIDRRSLALGAAVLAALFACPVAAEERVKVVASFSILGDLARHVGGDRIALKVLVGPDGDAHVYTPTPADAKAIAEARLVVVNGLGFEGWMERLVAASGSRAATVEASRGVETIALAEAPDDHGPDRAEARGRDRAAAPRRRPADPHAWQSVANAKLYVATIRDALAVADPEGRAAYEANAAAYLQELDALDREVRHAVAALPPDRRRVITSHDAFGYFARAYGLTFIAPQGVSTEAEASAKDVARLIRQIKREKAKAVFVENVSDERLLRQIAKETGARIGGTLYSDALSGADGPAGTYIDMIRHNMRTLSAALAS